MFRGQGLGELVIGDDSLGVTEPTAILRSAHLVLLMSAFKL